MSTIKAIVSLVVFFLYAGTTIAADFKNNSVKNENLVKYINSFESLGDLMDDMEFVGYLQSADRKEISDSLKQLGISEKTKTPYVREEGNKIKFGKTAVLNEVQNGKFKTADGQYIKVSKSSTPGEIFRHVVNMQMGKKVYSSINLIISLARAESVDVADAALSALLFLSKHDGAIIYGDVLIPATGALGISLGGYVEVFNWIRRSWVLNGAIKCENGTYVAIGFDQGLSFFEIWNKKQNELTKDTVDETCRLPRENFIDQVALGHFTTSCKVSLTGIGYFLKSFENREKNIAVQESVLLKELGSPVPPCNEHFSKILAKKIKSSLNTEMMKVKTNKPIELIKPSNQKGAS